MPDMLGPVVLRYCGICFCSPYCRTGPPAGSHAVSPHGTLYRRYSALCSLLAGTLTLFSLVTFLVEWDNFQELADAMICFCSLYTTWVYIRTWRDRGGDLHRVLATHRRFLQRYELLCRQDEKQRSMLEFMFWLDHTFTLWLLATLLSLIVLVVLQSCYTLVPPLQPVPRDLYAPPPAEGEVDPLGGGRTLRFALILVFQCPALLCCGVPFACLSAIHFALNAHAIVLLRCIKRSLELCDDKEGQLDGVRGQRAPVDLLVMQHQHVLTMVNANNDIFARPISERLAITYALLGLTAYCISTDPFADVKVPIIAFFMIVSLLQMAVLSDMLKDECGSLQDVVWRCDWMSSSRATHRKLLLLTSRAQRFNRDGLAAAGMQERISSVTFVQVMRSSVSFLQALRNLK